MNAPRPLGSRYELLDLLGTGAMGEVWRARDRESGEELAAKVLRAEYARDTEIVTRFIQERSILMNLRHPNIVQVHDLVVEGDRLGILMELVEGGDLRGRLKAQGTLGRRDAVAATCAVLDGLTEAHAQGCLHRDVKPDNALLSGDIAAPGGVKLSDFSIARLAQESTVMATGLLGTPGYMPPELFVHGQFSAASDVYAAGVLLYELLSGRTPFAGSGTAHTIGNRHVSAEPPRIPVDDELWHVVATMLSKDPRVRLTAAATAEALRELPDHVLDQPSLPVQAHPESFGPALHTALRPSPIRVQGQPSELDPGATNLHAGREAFDPLAATGDVVAFAPAPVAGEDVTSVGRAAPVHHAPVLTPAAVAEPEKPRRRWVPWLIGAVALAVLGGGGIAVAQALGGSSGPGEDGDPTTGVTAQEGLLPGDDLPSGLVVDRAMTWDPETGLGELAITYTAADAPLTGPFFESVPAVADGEACPDVTWAGTDQAPTSVRATGIADPCGFSVDVGGVLDAGQSIDVVASVDLDLGEDPEAVDAWLQRAADTTQADLESDAVVPGLFPVQRLAAIRMEVQDGLTMRSRDVEVRLIPQWVDGTESITAPLFNTAVTGDPSPELMAVAGGLENVKLRENCGGAMSVENFKVSVVRTATDCTLEAEVGEYDGIIGGPFSIDALGG
ncbi:hypothetical protein GCM10009623_27550 [Nocardioides aestuarii]|uniref:Serine/threonine-protein kinase n=1 Tax=Nocardioides aestuarii TaxID=252231 RepID=A0ABW4TQ65_9ACTN